MEDGGHDVISYRKVSAPGEWKRNVCPAPIQQCQQFMIYGTSVLV